MSTAVRIFELGRGQQIQIRRGDITLEHVDGIVNAANAYLQHGGGVAGAISLNGGSSIQEESDGWVDKHGPVQHAVPAYTTGGNLHCKFVIHAVGPVWGEGDEDRKLADAVAGSLRTADHLGLNSIAFPAISTGVFGFPIERAAHILLLEISNYFMQHPDTLINDVRLVLFDNKAAHVFLEAANSILGEGEISA